MAGGRRNEHKHLCAFWMSTNAFGGIEGTARPQPAFNRAVEKRSDSNWLSEVFSTSALIIPLLGNKNLIKYGEPVLLPSTSFPTNKVMEMGCLSKPIFLGLTETTNEPIFAVEVSGICSEGSKMPSWLEGTEWVDLRRYGSQLRIEDAGLLAYARGMVEWHTRNRFCGCCGEKTEFKEGGHSLQCSSTTCGSSAYPRLDPAIIVLVTCGDYLLMGRQSRWDQGRYSLLAGFVEVGETFETTVAREVHEEAGIKLDFKTIKYIASQPWPFPSSIMVGFIAEAKEKLNSSGLNLDQVDDVVPVGNEGLHKLIQRNSLPTVEVDSKELEDARWIHRSFLRAVLQETPSPGTAIFSVPGKHAIAHSLMQQWVSHHKETEWAGNQITTVEIDEGVFKYVLIHVYDGCGNQKLVVRGNTRMAYHADIFNDTKEKLKNMELQGQVLGGGRIEHHLNERIIHVYGFSQAYGRANHAVTVTLLQQWFPLHAISLSWDGY